MTGALWTYVSLRNRGFRAFPLHYNKTHNYALIAVSYVAATFYGTWYCTSTVGDHKLYGYLNKNKSAILKGEMSMELPSEEWNCIENWQLNLTSFEGQKMTAKDPRMTYFKNWENVLIYFYLRKKTEEPNISTKPTPKLVIFNSLHNKNLLIINHFLINFSIYTIY